MHNSSAYVIKWCVENDIDTLVVGKNKEWKQNVDMSKQSNQKFVNIPYQMLLQQLQYKCENVELNMLRLRRVILQEQVFWMEKNLLSRIMISQEEYREDCLEATLDYLSIVM